ncbi:hypothetical protein TNCV_3423391 [Trichonephila clavipes]|nr:hypothetical protein TNCV_3423391 [Trichonephila clavipes]
MYGGYFSVDHIFQFRQTYDGPDRYTRISNIPTSRGSLPVLNLETERRPWVPAVPANDSVFPRTSSGMP